MGGMRFTRETTRTFAVGLPVPASTSPQPPCPPDALCGVLACLLSDPAMQKLLESRGVDLPRLRRCLEVACRRPEAPHAHDDPCARRPKPCSATANKPEPPIQPQQILRLLRMVAAASGSEPTAVPPIVPVTQPQVDPALFDAPMFMPVMAWNKDGEAIYVTGHTGDMDVPSHGCDDADDKDNSGR